METLFVGLGGALGTVTRYLFALGLSAVTTGLPIATLLVNITGSFLLAFFVEWAVQRLAPNAKLHRFISTGFFGAYTTFSTYSYEVITYLNAGDWMTAFIYILLTTGGCLAGAYFGLVLAHRVKR